jgi:hypothetical protein
MDDGTFKSELGLLGLLGYRVGNNGRLFSERKKILDRVWALPITPDVKEKVKNWEEWGDPKSTARCVKLMTALATFANRPGMKQAAADWQRDLDYVKSAFREK